MPFLAVQNSLQVPEGFLLFLQGHHPIGDAVIPSPLSGCLLTLGRGMPVASIRSGHITGIVAAFAGRSVR
jgi:hypothetical protein